MSLGAALFSVLTNAVAVSSILGSRVYPMIVPPKSWDGASLKPCAVYRTSGKDINYLFCEADSLERETATIDVYAEDADTTFALADAVKNTLHQTKKVTVGSTYVDRAFLQSEFDTLDMEPGLFRRTLTFTIYHRSV